MTETVQLRYRINRKLKQEAEKVLDNLQCDPGSAISMFYQQVIRSRGLPFRPSEFPALDEYGATPADAEAASRAVIRDFSKAKPGQVFEFTGKL